MTPSAAEASATAAVRRWVLEHDDRWLFTVSYIGLAVVLSVWISLFWLAAVVGVHFGLEWIRQGAIHQRRQVLAPVLWEIKLDLALILFAVAIAVYMDLIMGIAGVGGAARLGVQASARAGGWGRALRGVLLSVDDAAQAARVVARGGGSGATPPGQSRWSLGDHIAFGLGLASAGLLAASPWLTEHDAAAVAGIITDEFQPFPGE